MSLAFTPQNVSESSRDSIGVSCIGMNIMTELQKMTWLPTVVLALTLGTELLRAQSPPAVPALPSRPGFPSAPGIPGNPGGVVEPTFDIDFPGGTVVEFVAAVGAARGRSANILIDENDRSIRIPKFAMRQVTLGSLMQAINRLGRMREQGFEFDSGNYAVPGEAVWSLAVVRPRSAAEEQVKFFNLEPFLSKNSVEDITTALNAGYQLKTGSNERLNLKFHKETQLLMVRGGPEVLAMVADVLTQLKASQPPAKPLAKPSGQ